MTELQLEHIDSINDELAKLDVIADFMMSVLGDELRSAIIRQAQSIADAGIVSLRGPGGQ